MKWSLDSGSNGGPARYRHAALPTELSKEVWRRDRESNPGAASLRPSGFQPAPFGLSGISPIRCCPRVAAVFHPGATRTPTARCAPLRGGVGLAGPVFRCRKLWRKTAGADPQPVARSNRFQGGARRRPGSSSVFWSRATDSNGDLPGPKPGDLPISPTREQSGGGPGS